MPRQSRRHPHAPYSPHTPNHSFTSRRSRPARPMPRGQARYDLNDLVTPQKIGFLARAREWFETGAMSTGRQALGGLWQQGLSFGRGSFHRGDLEIGGTGAGLGLASLLNALDWDNVRAEVERESRAHVVLIGGVGAGKTTLLYQLKGFMPEEIQVVAETETESESEDDRIGTRVENLGFFAVVDVPAASPNGILSDGNTILFELENADLIVWVMDAHVGLRTWEYEWIQRVRAMGKAMLIVANKLDAGQSPDAFKRWGRVLGCEILPVAASTGMNVATLLVPRLADTSPGLATALGREITTWRRDAAGRAMRRAATLSGLTGLEPIPLLDLPFQIFIQLQMVLRIAAIYGQPLNDRYSREMLATMVSAVALRFGGQQLFKVIPFVGWAASGALAAAGTWTIGRIALEYFERGKSVGLRFHKDEGGGMKDEGKEMGREGEIERRREGEREGVREGEGERGGNEGTEGNAGTEGTEEIGRKGGRGKWEIVKRARGLANRIVRRNAKRDETGGNDDGATV
ncbi:MAG: DUF697 domain-containing protein [Chloroflexi bacterium]|nr:DUF697 domain-containing protein [Chloroflexota bacterium]